MSDTPKEQVCKKALISEQKGYGLVALRDLVRGDCILAEPVIVIGDTIGTLSSVEEYNQMLAQELRLMGDDFVHDFFKLPAFSKETYGRLGAHFDRCAIPCPNAVVDGSFVRALGITLSWVNHGCIPNAQHTLVAEESDDEQDLGYNICIRAVRPIKKGEEITVPYEYFYMETDLRLCHIQYTYGFQCICTTCLYPDEAVEGHLGFIYNNLCYICDPEYFGKWPLNALKRAHAVMMAAFDANLMDSRYPRILEQAARICAYHSDYGRAKAFVETAEAFCFVVEGFSTRTLDRLFLYEKNPKLIPGSGQTTIGYSTKEESSKAKQLDVFGLRLACMDNSTEYIRLCDYDDRTFASPSKPRGVATPGSDQCSSTVQGDDNQNDESQSTDNDKDKDKAKEEERAASPKVLDPKDLDALMKELQLEKTAHDKKRLRSKKKAANKKAKRDRKAKENLENEKIEPKIKQESDAEDAAVVVVESFKEAAKPEEDNFFKPTSLSWADMDSDEDGVWQTVSPKKTKRNRKQR